MREFNLQEKTKEAFDKWQEYTSLSDYYEGRYDAFIECRVLEGRIKELESIVESMAERHTTRGE